MKKLLFVIILFTAIFSIQLNAQVKKNQIKTSLVFVFAESFQLSYERLLNDEMSLNLEATLGNIESIRTSFRYYLSENPAPNGSFIAPTIHIRMDEDFGAGIMVGHQRLFKEKISLEAFIGPEIFSSGVNLWGGINLGFAF